MDIRLRMILLLLFIVLLYFGIWKIFSSLGIYLFHTKRWRNGHEKTLASISGFLDDHGEKSKHLVEKKLTNGSFQAIPETTDRTVHYFTFPNPKKRSRLILEWNIGADRYRAFYPYARNKWPQTPGDTVELHYNQKKPWLYAIADPGMAAELTKCGLIGILLTLTACIGFLYLF